MSGGRSGTGLFMGISLAAHLLMVGGLLLFYLREVPSVMEPIAVEVEPLAPLPARMATLPPALPRHLAQKPITSVRRLPRRRAGGSGLTPTAAAMGAPLVPEPSTTTADPIDTGTGDDGAGTGASAGSGAAQSLAAAAAVVKRPLPPMPLVNPQAINVSRPRYPLSARRRRAEGLAMVRVRVGTTGAVLEAQLATSTGADDLDRSALEAARSWRFRPGRRGDRTVEAWVNVPVRFRLEGDAL